MRTGYCIESASPAMHAKCTQPDRCVCDCHRGVAVIVTEEIAAVSYDCPTCGVGYPKPQGLGAHYRHNPDHKRPAPVKPSKVVTTHVVAKPIAVEDAELEPPVTAPVYEHLAWHDGLLVDITISTGTDQIDPTVLRTVLDLIQTVETLR